MTSEPGVYQLGIRLVAPVRLQVGRLGVFDFPAGHYVYTGSAMGGLRRRVERHLRTEKVLRWHIDYLLCHALVESVRLLPTRERLECALNQETLALPGAEVIARGFGSSDCRCTSHLVFLAGSDADAWV